MRTLNQIVKRLVELKNEFTEYDEDIHDNIYYQLRGIAESDEDDEALIRDLNELVDQLEKHLDNLKHTPNFNWIFG